MRQLGQPSIRIVAATIVMAAIAACGEGTPSSPPRPSIGPFPVISPVRPSAVASSDASAPSPSAGSALQIDGLPNVTLDPATQTGVCDPQASQLDTEAGEATIPCGDGLALGLRALTMVASGPIERLYLQRPTCRAIPCTPDELSTATVSGWTTTDAHSVALDSREPTVEVSTPDPAAAWPAGSTTAPAAQRPSIEGAPAEISDRTPYPYCGESELGEPESVTGCFREAVLSGRPAELIERYVGTEEGLITRLYRFEGRGALTMYQRSDGRWFRQAGSMILGFTPGAFDFDPWSGTDRQF